MPKKSGKDTILFEKFKTEAKIVNLKSSETGITKKIIKWKDKTFNTGSFHEVFEAVKKQIYQELK